ncbi:hypothetical protein HG530_011949 [Fusarium avenaceum]|nr:hypothetical protein HG530_011949 [Fusarium avenaceum]
MHVQSTLQPPMNPTSRLQSLLRLLGSLHLRKSTLCGLHALHDQRRRNENPDRVAEHVVHPEVELLRATVHDVVHDLVEVACRKVENDTVDLSNADDELEWVAQRVLCYDSPGAEE